MCCLFPDAMRNRHSARGTTLESSEPHDQGTAPMAVASKGVTAVGRAGGGSGGGLAVRAVLRALGTTLSQIENASLLLNSLSLSHTTSTPDELLQSLVVYYRGQVG